jgi:chromosome segregation protein
MRLQHIKLAGFKSFVDPTVVSLPGNLSGIVGPNGCGKSNIIDAVRWVMGESSAKQLRGESMADVIFNGSSSRKPAGQASIELHFDNSDGGLGGIYAQYPEIVIRRQVSLEGQSVYYLNGTVCRRRDITDIFLGTGLGPRSYAIIEQGTISRLIEAKPEELRIYLEEAAGISKYKERRRETELRLQHTRDNLARLNDLRDELQKQIDHLSKQAATAEKYQLLKDQEHNFRSQLLALRATNLQHLRQEEQVTITTLEQQLEKFNTEWQSLATQRELAQQQQVEANDAVQEVQREYYQYNTELARLEQHIQHHREKQHQLEQDKQHAQLEAEHVTRQIESETDHAQLLQQQIEILNPQHIQAKSAAEEAQVQLQQLETTAHEWQTQWDEFNQQAAHTTQEAQVEQTKIQHLEKHLLQIQERLTRLHAELEKYLQMQLPLGIQEIQQQMDDLSQQVTQEQQHLNDLQGQLYAKREDNQQQQQRLDQSRTALQAQRGRYASLQALQEAALGKNSEATVTWLRQHHLDDKPRLAEKIKVIDGWDLAVETILSQYLEAICIDDFDSFLPSLSQLTQGGVTLIDNSLSQTADSSNQQATSLISQVHAPDVVLNLLSGIYIAENLLDGIALVKQLAANETVVTRDGIWVGKGWLRVSSKDDQKSGVLSRERELTEVDQQIAQRIITVEEQQSLLEQNQHVLRQLEDNRDTAQKQLSVLSSKYAELNAQLKVQQAQLNQAQQRKSQLHLEEQELCQQQQREQEALFQARNAWQQLMQQVEQDALKRDSLQKHRDEQREVLLNARQETQHLLQQAHQLSTQIEVLQTQLQASVQQHQRLIEQQAQIAQKQHALTQQFNQGIEPEKALSDALNQLLSQQSQTEKHLHEKRDYHAGIEEQVRTFEKQQQEIDVSRSDIRVQLEQHRLQQQAATVRVNTIIEQLQEMGCDLSVTQTQLPAEASETNWEEQLNKIVQRIERLGPINLAAISEHTTQSERKNYLDTQHEDLITALNTLEDAIHKIDKETRARFKEVYEKVNTTFQQLFPRIFGGGSASLELIGDDLLQTGVNVIARPPGKRNSTIHLLSGGEKALTAIALVFAIFQLNPAPFCMLDEVDAPLDDANIGRFCELVREMSKNVQFIFISHNKLAIEMAEHLLGVTMNEPGVSRLVAVDINAAMEMAAA